MRYTLITILAALALCLAQPLTAQVTFIANGYEHQVVTLPFLYTGGDIAADPNDPDAFYFSSDSYQAERIYHVDLSDPMNPVATLVADGTVDQGSDSIYDNRFGSTTVFPLPSGDLIISDNDFGTSDTLPGVLGETILIANDLNMSGDFLDVGEISELVDPTTFSGPNYSGLKGTIGPDGRGYITTADGGGNGEVIAFATDGTSIVRYLDGLSFGAGVDFLSDGRVVAGNADDGFSTGSVVIGEDLNMNTVVTDSGETTVITDSIFPISDLNVSSDDGIYASVNSFFAANKVVKVDAVTGATEDLINFNAMLSPFGNFVTTIEFDSSSNSFAPGPATGPVQKLLVYDFSLGLVLVTPTLMSTSELHWELY